MSIESIPVVEFENLYESDSAGRRFWDAWYPEKTRGLAGKHLSEMGRSAALAHPLSFIADKKSPELKTHDFRGERVDRIEYHPAYHELEKLSYGKGAVAVKFGKDFLGEHKASRHLTGFGGGYYFAFTEPSLFCPLCMTDGVGRVLERNAPDAKFTAKTISRLAATDRAKLWRGAMFLTEAQGGSDVGTNTARAEETPEGWKLYGEKWFCSNVDAEAILALARLPGAPEGTEGLGLFLVLREEPAGNSRAIRIHRIKDKLGVRSMPTGEITFEGARAELIGGTGQGFKQMAEMLNLSRMYNSVASVGVMRSAIFQALGYGHKRKAFGATLDRLPLWRSVMADVIAEHLIQFSLVFETVRLLDASDCGDEQAGTLVRQLTPVAKAVSAKSAVAVVSECMESIGGNAYIEESILPRLLRDAQVLPIWEGTTNILSLDFLRSLKPDGGEALLKRISGMIEKGAAPPEIKKRLSGVWAELKGDLEALAGIKGEERQRRARGLIEKTGRLFGQAVLCRDSSDGRLKEICVAALERQKGRGNALQSFGSGVPHAASEEALLTAYRGDAK